MSFHIMKEAGYIFNLKNAPFPGTNSTTLKCNLPRSIEISCAYNSSSTSSQLTNDISRAELDGYFLQYVSVSYRNFQLKRSSNDGRATKHVGEKARNADMRINCRNENNSKKTRHTIHTFLNQNILRVQYPRRCIWMTVWVWATVDESW